MAADAPSQLLEKLGRRAPENYLQWLRTGREDTTQLVPTSSVVYFRSDRKYTSVFTASEEHLIRTSIKELAGQLDPDVFWQIHRGIIVNVGEVVKAQRDIRGHYTLPGTRKRR